MQVYDQLQESVLNVTMSKVLLYFASLPRQPHYMCSSLKLQLHNMYFFKKARLHITQIHTSMKLRAHIDIQKGNLQ